MKKILYFAAIFCLSFVFILPVQAQQKDRERIQSYEVNIEINKNNSINVVESIEYDFGAYERHGIYRNIPLSNNGSFFKDNIEIRDVEVKDKNGQDRPFKESIKGGQYKIKIGDPDETVTDVQTYNIKYTVEDVVGFYENHDELYWNAIGSDWDVPILSSNVTVELPDNLSRDELTIECFIGQTGSENSCDNQSYDSGVVTFSDLDVISPGETFTVVVGFPKEIVKPPTLLQQTVDIIKDNWYLLVPPLVLIIMFGWWWKSGRDPEGRGNVISQYEPPNGMSPIEIGMLMDSKIDDNDISAQIIHLANQGFLKIKYEEKDKLIGTDKIYTLIQKKDPSKAENNFDQDILYWVFGSEKEIKLSNIDPSNRKINNIKTEVIDRLVDNGYYKQSPKKIRGYFFLAAFFIVFGFFFLPNFSLAAFISSIVTAVIVAGFGYFMPSKTKEGAILQEEILGFKDYLSVAEKERMEFHNAPEKKPEIFVNFLPYAMAMEVEEQWAEIFDGIYEGQPKWYEGPAGHMGAYAVANDMDSFGSAVGDSALSSSGSSSGVSGGSAGGGAGGGGGGSW